MLCRRRPRIPSQKTAMPAKRVLNTTKIAHVFRGMLATRLLYTFIGDGVKYRPRDLREGLGSKMTLLDESDPTAQKILLALFNVPLSLNHRLPVL